MISKEKILEASRESYKSNEFKNLNSKIEQLEKEKIQSQRKFDEIQEFVKDLEEENMTLKSKLKILINQLKFDENGKEKSQVDVKEMSKQYEEIQNDYQQLLDNYKIIENNNKKILEENSELKELNLKYKEKIDELTKEICEYTYKNMIHERDAKKNEEKEAKEITETFHEMKKEESTEKYLQYFKNLKNEMLEINKKSKYLFRYSMFK